MSDPQIIITIDVEETPEGFFYVIDGKPPIGPFADEELATQAAIDFLQDAMTKMAEEAIMGKSK